MPSKDKSQIELKDVLEYIRYSDTEQIGNMLDVIIEKLKPNDKRLNELREMVDYAKG